MTKAAPKHRAMPRLAPVHQPLTEHLNGGGWRANKRTAAQRGYGYRWQKARDQYLQEHPLCVMCQDAGTVKASAVVDHITPHRGDVRLFWDENNWQALCKTHHDGEKQRQERANERGAAHALAHRA